MKRIAVLYGMEETFPPALVDRINSIDPGRVSAEHLKVGAVSLGQPPGYDVIIDRISHDISFYRAYLKNAVLEGATGHQQSLLVERRRQVLQLRPGEKARRGRPADRHPAAS